MPKEIGMKKLFVSVIFFAIGLICVQAQTQAVPRPPLPVFTFTQDTPQAVRQNVSEAQARQLIENRDQLKYAEYLKNSGYITDLSGVFDGCEDVYSDACHVKDALIDRIAERML